MIDPKRDLVPQRYYFNEKGILVFIDGNGNSWTPEFAKGKSEYEILLELEKLKWITPKDQERLNKLRRDRRPAERRVGNEC